MSGVQTQILVRPWRDDDLAPVLDLLQAALGDGPAGSRPAEFFTWKHLENPFGPSLMLVAEADGRPVGLRAFMRWRFRTGERTIEAVQLSRRFKSSLCSVAIWLYYRALVSDQARLSRRAVVVSGPWQ